MDTLSSQTPNPSQIYLPMLRESIDHFLLEHKNGCTDFSNFSTIFFRIIRNLPDPPLEIIWFYAAVTHHSARFTYGDPSEPLLRVKDLFQLLVGCSSSSSSVKKIAVLAPVFHELYGLLFDRKIPGKEFESFLEIIISYISICCGEGTEEEDESEALSSCFEELIKIWAVDKFRRDVRGFFPMVSDGVCESIRKGCGFAVLAGIVMYEAFTLRLCLKFDSRVLRAELERDMHEWVVQTISGFKSFHFLDTLLMMMLDPVLPVTSLLKFEDEILLREVLYNAVIMVDYPFISSQHGGKHIGKQLKNVAVLLLLVAERATRYVRENEDDNKVHTYMNALSNSFLPVELFKWITYETGAREITSRPTVYSPAALIKWLLIIDDLGVKIFENNFLKLHAKAIVCKSRVEYEIPVFKLETGESAHDDIYSSTSDAREDLHIDSDSEMVDQSEPSSPTSSCFVISQRTSQDTRKRKDVERIAENEVPMKLPKFHLHEHTVRCQAFQSDNRIDADNPIYCGDTLQMEH
ncbi:hypothetical protein SAY87_019158 [Trapa incisa]|uniref:Uncharacterized protein n=1 Tax=Trapa incisa TaxID=236973 RepID=A0AAN7K209_9MYRT|nr:hypothetical protein SAY87_019158 [Trapa incisa]